MQNEGPFSDNLPPPTSLTSSHVLLQTKQEAPQQSDRPNSIDLSGAVCK